MATRIPLVLSPVGQVEQLPPGDNLPFNIGDPGQVVVVTTTIAYSQTHMAVYAWTNKQVWTITGGSPNDLLYIRGAYGTKKVEFEKGKGNIYGGGKRKIDDFDQILVLLNVNGSWVEVSWQG
jgi:hypothetical protein